MDSKVVALLLLFVLSQFGCSRGKENLTLAKVGERKIRAKDLQEFVATLPAHYRSKKTGVDAQREYLQVLIDKEFLLMEARTKGLDKREEVQKRLREERRGHLIAEYLKQEVDNRVTVTEEELRDLFVREHYDRAVRPAHIVVKTEEEARAVLDEITKGKPFGEVARAQSLHTETAQNGGDFGRFFRKDEVRSKEIAERAFATTVGEISEPVRTSYGYEILTILDEMPVEFETVKATLMKVVQSRKGNERYKLFVEELEERFSPKLNPAGARVVLQWGNDTGRELTATERETAVYEYKGGKVTVGDCITFLGRPRQQSDAVDSTQLIERVRQTILRDALLLRGAQEEGLEKDRLFRRWTQRREEDLLIETLRKVEIEDSIRVTEEDARREYLDNLQTYMLQPEVRVQEVLVLTEEEATRLLGEVKRGADLGEIAAKHTIRSQGKADAGRFHIHPHQTGVFGELAGEVFRVEVGKLYGPLKVQGGYSIFKVLERYGERPKPFEQVRSQAMAMVKLKRQNAAFEELLIRLRKTYGPSVTIFDKNLRKIATT